MKGALFGVTLPQFSDDIRALERAAKEAEERGFDSLWLFDHLWPLSGGKQRPVLECWTTLAWLAERTELRIGTLVTRSSLRGPAMLGHMAATVATIAPGRLTVAIGSGDEMSRPENVAFGLPYWEGADRIGQFAETVRAVRSHLDGHPNRPAIWVAGRSDDALEVAARLGDGWNAWAGTPERFRQDASNVTALAGDRDLELTWGGIVRDDSDAEVVAAIVEAGARHVIMTPPNASADDAYERPARIREGLR